MNSPATHPFLLHRALDHEAMSRAAADAVIACVRRKPDALLVLATGATPERAYGLLAEQAQVEPGLFNRVRLLKLDEWGGLAPDDPATCEMYIRRVLVEPLRITSDRFHGWESRPADVAAECARVSRLLEQQGPADISILGLWINGHLGFNEPADALQPGPHQAELSAESRGHSMLQSSRSTPRYGLTLGIRDLLQSRELFLLVSGKHKRQQLQRLLQPEITPQFPGSFLWLHRAATIFCDAEASPVS